MFTNLSFFDKAPECRSNIEACNTRYYTRAWQSVMYVGKCHH